MSQQAPGSRPLGLMVMEASLRLQTDSRSPRAHRGQPWAPHGGQSALLGGPWGGGCGECHPQRPDRASGQSWAALVPVPTPLSGAPWP